MRFNPLFLFLLVWLGTEIAVFAIVVHVAGLSGAILFGLLTSLVGLVVLRRVGLAATLGLRDKWSARENFSREALFDGSLAALGSLLLILPGFVSDLVGLALIAPTIRSFVMDRLQTGKFGTSRGPRHNPQTIELSPDEWTRKE
ncbi:FxsA cytoplasmic membrane protein [Beijerinckia indica subsp. indica ATCC 9039]|uniref:FxsA cytoplasmic membrane protein n=2 Tax=Beijerinckia TaxID=532 RepID=B2IC74_BEII9|nr:FxsA cytoplasmic membrane protein [Beijerinckia indica subsp. indica ATCC 9039]